MSNTSAAAPKGTFGRIIHDLEETIIALLLGVMTLLTFANVVLRYGFNTSLIWGLEVVLILFAWLVLFGITYSVKVTSHLGVDAIINLFGPKGRKICALVAAAVCLAYAGLLMKGAWDYWAPYAALDRTSGRWFPTGFEQTRDQAWYVTDQVPMLDFLRFLEPMINQSEEYEKLPRVIPYAMLPFACALLLYRFVQATVRILRGTQDSLIVSHEAEDAVEDAAKALKD